MDLFVPQGEIKCTLRPDRRKIYFLTSSSNKNRVQYWKNIYFTCMIVVLALLKHQTSNLKDKHFFP